MSLTATKEVLDQGISYKQENNSKNKGGSTSYYDIPKGAKTLNDLIEYKNMSPNLHEIFKATYAIDERAKRNIEGQDRLRELNKIKYYCEREIAIELRKQNEKA